ncbi:hypothetical protein GGR08_000124 [Bartonella fuyuanensis]|uniref:Uncharacterized protein n=1 Tax=Bartonella fuyuanensis TaxID=1460968 RepID=A0A840DVZ5_9HYPH|nr:hypothetical protein [Bartonella fuyuanensis]
MLCSEKKAKIYHDENDSIYEKIFMFGAKMRILAMKVSHKQVNLLFTINNSLLTC